MWAWCLGRGVLRPPLEVDVVTDHDSTAMIRGHASPHEVSERIEETMSSTREDRQPTSGAGPIPSTPMISVRSTRMHCVRSAKSSDERRHIGDELDPAVRSGRNAQRPWSETGAMLGATKQADPRKYANKSVAWLSAHVTAMARLLGSAQTSGRGKLFETSSSGSPASTSVRPRGCTPNHPGPAILDFGGKRS